MKKVSVSAILGISVIGFCIYHSIDPIGPVFKSAESSVEPGNVEGSKPDSPDEFEKYFHELRTMEGQEVSGYTPGYRFRELTKAKENLAGARTKAVSWVERGPGNVSGRTRGLIIHPDDPSGRTWIAGSASGGVWKTENGGLEWVNLTPDLPNLSTSTLAMSPSNTAVIYAGTGEGYFNSGSVAGDGIFKTSDGGQTWDHIVKADQFLGLQHVNRIIADPSNADIVLACGNGFPPFTSGIYKSTDGGLSWETKFNASARVQQIIANPVDFNVQYATINGQGIIKSSNAGETWSSTGNGLSASGRIELAISPVNTQRMFASAESSLSGGNSSVFVSDDGGDNWNLVGAQSVLTKTEWLGEQGWYDNTIAAHPFDENIVYVGGIQIFKADVTSNIRKKSPTVTGVSEEGTEEFMAWINAGLSFLRGGLATGNEWFEDNEGFPIDFADSLFRSVEIRFGPGKKQMAHRFTVLPNSGAGNDGGAGVVPLDHIYQDYVEVPFEVWDVDENRQLMVSFRDQEKDGVWNLIERSDTDPVPGREYIFVNAITYDPDNPDPNIAKAGGHGYKTMYCMWPTLTAGAIFDAAALPDSKLVINYGRLEERISTIDQITTGSSSSIHVDMHNIQMFSSQEGTFKMIVATDGGIYFSTDEADPGTGEQDWHKGGFGYNTTQFYGVDKKANSNNYVGGTQDNGTWITLDPDPGAASTYTQRIGGDGFDVVWSYFEPDLVIGSSQNNRFLKSTDGGITWESATNGLDDSGDTGAPFFTKVTAHKLLPRVLLAVGETGVWRSNDFAKTWFVEPMNEKWVSSGGISSAQRIEFSRSNPNIIWAGGGMTVERNLHVSVNGGQSFRMVSNIADTIGSISGLATHPLQDSTAYVLFSFAQYGKIFRTKDLGSTWEDISGFNGGKVSTNGFPDVEVRTLLVLPHEPQTLWAGTEIGIFESTDDGASWHLLTGNLPAVSTWKLIAVDDQVVAATHGRGIWTATLPGLKWPIDVVSGIEDEVTGAGIRLYPNPSDNRTTIAYEHLEPGRMVLRVMDQNGRLMYEKEHSVNSERGQMELNTAALAGGVYILSIRQKGTTRSSRLVVRH